MWKWWRASRVPGIDRPGDALITLAVACVTAAGLGNLAPPGRVWVPALLGMAGLAAWRGVARFPRGRPWWGTTGVLLGFAACALAPSLANQESASPASVRFTVAVRDGWSAAQWGWRARVRVEELTGKSHEALRHPKTMVLYLGGTHPPTELTPGSRWRGAGEVVFDPDRPLARPQLRVKTALLLVQVGEARGADFLRERVMRKLLAAGAGSERRERAAALAGALVLGRREGLNPEELVSMRRAGLAHLLAVSGLHVGLVAVLAWGALAIAGVGPVWRRRLLLVVLVVFAIMAGGQPPVRRAATAGVLYLVGRMVGRPLIPLATMWGVVAVLVLVEPGALLEAGFLLSAGVALALIRWVVPVAGRLLPGRPGLGGALSVAVVAHLASAPLVGHFFGAVPPLGAVANLLAAAVAAVVVGAALVAAVAAGIAPLLALPALEAVAACQRLLGLAARAGGLLVWPVANVPPWLWVGGGLAGVLGLLPWRRAWIPALGVGLGFWVWIVAPGVTDPGRFEVHMLGVGEGSAVLLSGGGGTVLFDTGRWPEEASRLLAGRRIRRLDGLLLSHADADHIGGAAAVLDRHRVASLLLPASMAERTELTEILQRARARGVAVGTVAPGDQVQIGGWECTVLWPRPGWSGGENDQSLVARCQGGGVTVLLTGDLEAAGERMLLAGDVSLGAEVLQLGHHGSRTSSSSRFLQAVEPRIALAATGIRPRFSFPHGDVVRRVRRVPAVMVTQKDGLSRVWWRAEGPLVIDLPHPVLVSRRELP